MSTLRRVAGFALAGIVLLGAAGCDLDLLDLDGGGDPEGERARQLRLLWEPELVRRTTPSGDVLEVYVVARDSLAHRNWFPTTLRLETDRGYAREVDLRPFACLEPEGGGRFPHNFAWWACDAIGVETAGVLSQGEELDLERRVDGWIFDAVELSSRSRYLYYLRVPIGRRATEVAVERARDLSFVERANRVGAEPACATGGGAPPPCPDWYLWADVPLTYFDPRGGELPVSPRGWIRAIYEEPDGYRRVTLLRLD